MLLTRVVNLAVPLVLAELVSIFEHGEQDKRSFWPYLLAYVGVQFLRDGGINIVRRVGQHTTLVIHLLWFVQVADTYFMVCRRCGSVWSSTLSVVSVALRCRLRRSLTLSDPDTLCGLLTEMNMLTYTHLLNLSYGFHANRKTGEVLSAIERGREVNNTLDVSGFSLGLILAAFLYDLHIKLAMICCIDRPVHVHAQYR